MVCIGQPHRGQSHETSRRLLIPGEHLAPNLREDGLRKMSFAKAQAEATEERELPKGMNGA